MIKRTWNLISKSFIIWENVNASRMSAALTYYTMLSLAPLMMIAIAIAGYVFDSETAQSEIVEQVQRVTTPEIAETVAGLIQNAVEPKTGLVAGSISVCVLVFGASGVFTQLTDTFNDIWDVPSETRSGWLRTIEKRLLGVGMVLIAGLALIGALVIDSTMAYLNQLVEGSYPKAVNWLSLADRSLSYLLMPFIFSVMFWFFPATKIKWRDVWPAGVLTALLVVASRYLIGLYLGFSTASEVYGAAGSLVVLLIWVYMTGLVIFYGASFSHAWADTFGSRSDFGKKRKSRKAQKKPADQPAPKKPEPTASKSSETTQPSKSSESTKSSEASKIAPTNAIGGPPSSEKTESAATAGPGNGVGKPLVPKRRPSDSTSPSTTPESPS